MTKTSNPKNKIKPIINPTALNHFVQDVLDKHQAEDVVVIDLQGKSTIGDYMIIATGRSSRQVISLSENLIIALKQNGILEIKPEGAQQGDWILIDAGDVIIHLFRPEVRDFYSLEKMWEADFFESNQSAKQTDDTSD